MRRALTALLCTTVLIAGAVACARRDPATPPAGPASPWPEGREFWSTAITEDGAPKTLVDGTKLTVRFGQPGDLGVSAGCNHLGFQVNIEGDQIKPYDYFMTLIGCRGGRAQQDKWVFSFFWGGPSWSVAGDELTLRTERIEIRLTDKEVLDPDRTLTGQRWVVTTIVSDETASSTLADNAYLEFATDGTITGTTGCATLATTSTVEGNAVTVGPIQRTERSCEGRDLVLADELDRAVMATLKGTVTFTIDARTLTLHGPDGHGLVLSVVA